MNTQPFNFTAGYHDLEKIVAELESKEIDLERDLPKFERGLKLASKLQKRLREIENTVIELEQNFREHEASE